MCLLSCIIPALYEKQLRADLTQLKEMKTPTCEQGITEAPKHPKHFIKVAEV